MLVLYRPSQASCCGYAGWTGASAEAQPWIGKRHCILKLPARLRGEGSCFICFFLSPTGTFHLPGSWGRLNKICFHKYNHFFNEMVIKASCSGMRLLKFLWMYPLYNKVKNEGWRHTQESIRYFIAHVWGLQGGLSLISFLLESLSLLLGKKQFLLICPSKVIHSWSLHFSGATFL